MSDPSIDNGITHGKSQDLQIPVDVTFGLQKRVVLHLSIFGGIPWGGADWDHCHPGSIVVKYPVDSGEVSSLCHNLAQFPAGTKIMEMKCEALGQLRALLLTQLRSVEFP